MSEHIDQKSERQPWRFLKLAAAVGLVAVAAEFMGPSLHHLISHQELH